MAKRPPPAPTARVRDRAADRARRALLPLLLAAALLGCAAAAGAREATPEITGIYVSREGAGLTVSGALRNVFTAPVEERLAAGLPLIVQVRFELCRDVRQRPDTKLAAVTLVRTATWDRLRQEYSFTEDGPAGQVRRSTRTRAELQALVTGLVRVPIVPLPPLLPGNVYYVQLQARIQTEKPSLPVDRLLFFVVPGWILSDWATSGYFTVEAAP
jgi:hypothetical protein